MTQLDGESKTIDGETYKILMLDPLVASDLLVDIAKVFGPALGVVGASLLKAENSKEALDQLLDGVKSEGNDAEAATEELIGDSLEKALIGLIDRVEKSKLREIINIMTDVTSVQKGNDWPKLASIFSVHFRGKIKAMYQWLAFAIRVQYRDFF